MPFNIQYARYALNTAFQLKIDNHLLKVIGHGTIGIGKTVLYLLYPILRAVNPGYPDMDVGLEIENVEVSEFTLRGVVID
jgi:hypothetical protein